jgi:Putative bacterial sensory transduction regulator
MNSGWIGVMALGIALAGSSQQLNAGEPEKIGRDAVTLRKTLTEMGYVLNSPQAPSDPNVLSVQIGETPTAIVLGGCDKLKTNCTYMVLVSSFTNVVNPSDQWINEQNQEYDLMKFYRREDKTLGFTHGFVTGDLTRASLKSIFELWNTSANDVGQVALKAKLVTN